MPLLEDQFHDAMLNIYKRAGAETGYWANYFLRAVKRHGGLVQARRMLQVQKNDSIQKGFQVLIDAGRIDLCMEALVLQPEFMPLFTDVEIQEARQRLQKIPNYVQRKKVRSHEIYPEVVSPEIPYVEGAVQKITINSFERNPKARAACLAKHGYSCTVCLVNFKERYGSVGEGFIHVHHKKPLAAIRTEYELDPVKDLIPVCPNCHAMLHTSEPPLSVSELKAYIESHSIENSDKFKP